MVRTNVARERASSPHASGVEDGPLLLTKIHRPLVASNLEPRDRLLEYLEHNGHKPLTLISAPPGYGKTTLVSMWLQARDGVGLWVSLDARDDDLLTFATYIVAALQDAFPTLEFKAPILLHTPVAPSPAILARYLSNDLHQIAEPFVLVLDDIHLVRQEEIFDLLGELLRYPPPALRLVLIGRRDPPLPIASLRARGQLAEIRARDLRFTVPETARLLGQTLQREIPSEVAVEWTEKTEGWVTALHLAALTLLHRDGTGDLRIDARPTPQFIQDYLWDELLARLPPAQYQWLLRTSVLDQLTPSLCEAICGTSASDECGLTGTEFIRWLDENNLFLIALDEEGRWYRLHHVFQNLLRDLLQQQMRPEEIARLHLRASAWYAAHGLPDEAIQYALAGGDADAAVRLIEQGRYELMNREQWARLGRWLGMAPAESAANSVLLTNARGFLALQQDDMAGTMAAVQRARQLLDQLPLESEMVQIAQAELDVLPSIPELYAGHIAETLASARRGLQTLPQDALHIRSLAVHSISVALHLSGAPERALEMLEAALLDPIWPASQHARLLHYLSLEHYLCGDLPAVLVVAAKCVAVATTSQVSWLAMWGQYYLGAAHYARNEFDAAEPQLLDLLENRDFARPVTLAFGAFALGLIRLAQKRADEAAAIVETAGEYLRRIGYSPAALLVDTFMTELALRQGAPPSALRGARPDDIARLPSWLFHEPRLTEIKLLLGDGHQDSLAAAQRRLASLETAFRGAGVKHILIDVLALKALVFRSMGEEDDALAALAEALQVSEPGGFVRNFVDLGAPMLELLDRLQRRRGDRRVVPPHLVRVLAAFSQAKPSRPASAVASLIEPLTEREQQLLRLLASDLSPDEMARQLALSPATVRTHIRNIYDKLDVHSRYEAVTRARAIDLL